MPLLAPGERSRLLVEWNRTEADYPRERCLHHLFEEQAARTPDAVALVEQERRLTYGELNARANRMAYRLRRQGIGPNVLVALYLERSIEGVVGLLGILKAGGAYVPLDPSYPKERLAGMLADAQAPVLLTRRAWLAQLPASAPAVICLDESESAWAGENEENPVTEVTPRDLAYVIYTSGSTGQPRGVMVEHTGVVNLVHWHQAAYPITPADRTSLVVSPSFDASVWELWPSLAAGASLHLPSDEIRLAPPRFLQWLEAEGITLCFLPTPLAEALLREPWPSGLALRLLMTGGDQLHPPPRALPCRLLNLYGPTEATVVATCAEVATGGEAGALPPIGRPIANTQVYLFDDQLQPVPVGAPGELYLGGVGLARGYLSQPALTAARFVPHPFSDRPGARLYRTGDQARYLPDGAIQFLGRLDDQAKIHGCRIELGEIEAALAQHPSVREAVVMVREDRLAEKQLVGYLVPQPGEAPASRTLRHFLREKLPEHMVPSAFVLLDALPLSPNGKIDRRGLPAPATAALPSRPPYVAPRDGVESDLAQLWEKLLEIQPVGLEDNFFDLGGDSLLAARLFAEIEERFGRDLPLASLYPAPTLAQLARLIREPASPPAASALVAIQAGGTKRPFFCVHGVGGNVLTFHRLARYLDREQPFYGLQAPRPQDRPTDRATVESIAARYLAEIRAIQPEGPYSLGGFSFGGMVAYEMAQQLRQAGETVALLALFDTGGPGYTRYWSLWRRLGLHARSLQRMSMRERGRYLAERLEAARRKLRLRRGAPPSSGSDDPPPLAQRLAQSRSLHRQASATYRPQPYPGRMLLFRAEQQGDYSDPELGWGGMARDGIEVHEIPGDHLTIMEEPFVQYLAEKLTACLNRRG